MTGWLKLTDEQRRITLTQAQQRSGIIAKAIEKDWWVTLVLKALFQSAYADHLVFKGGTSLSKGFKLINRFSEDIDLALAAEAFGMQYEENPTPSYISRLRRKGFAFTTTLFVEELNTQLISLGVPASFFTIEFDPAQPNQTPPDPQSVYVKYKPLYEPNKYIADQVKIEISVRSLKIPFTTRPIHSLLSEFFPNKAYEEHPFEVNIVEPRKTFLEKAFLLHEEFGKPDKTTIRTERMSRHFYDLAVIMNDKVAKDALDDHALYDGLIIHRERYIRAAWANYTTLIHSSISFLPPEELLEEYKKDYEEMREHMIYGEGVFTFEEVVNKLKELQGRFRLKKEVKLLEEIITDALNNLQDYMQQHPTATSFETQVVYTSDPYKPASPANKTIIFAVRFTRNGNKMIFESISVHEN
jgi:hypothetical protein